MSLPQISAVTYNARCVRSLLNTLRAQSPQPKGYAKPPPPNSTLLFALAPSPTTPAEDLSEIASTLTQAYPEHVGCISAPLFHQYFDSSIRGSGPNSCSLAYALVGGISFRSAISGPSQVQVGRWHAARQTSTEGASGATRVNIEDSQMQIISGLPECNGRVNWEDVWDRTANLVTSSPHHGNDQHSATLPYALRCLEPSATHNILYFSDKAPEGLANVLEGAFPRANKVSLIASSTPFITGRPVTLFHNGLIYSNGAVGIAFDSSPSSPSPVVELSFPPLVALSTNLSVTGCEGNLILSLDSRSPTRLLLSAIQKHGLASLHTTWVAKEDDFYVGVLDPSSQKLSQLHRIVAGDPSRGSIALDGISTPREGSIVRLYHLPRGPVPDTQRYVPDTISNEISLFVSPEITQAAGFGKEIADSEVTDTCPTVVPNAFLAASENGFTFSRAEKGPWKCVVPGSRLRMSWSPVSH